MNFTTFLRHGVLCTLLSVALCATAVAEKHKKDDKNRGGGGRRRPADAEPVL
jgi:hypothetical protein